MTDRTTDRLRGARLAFNLARKFGVGRVHAAWRAVRFLFTGRTGMYHIAISVKAADNLE